MDYVLERKAAGLWWPLLIDGHHSVYTSREEAEAERDYLIERWQEIPECLRIVTAPGSAPGPRAPRR